MARGFTQTYGVDYNKIFAPVAKFTSIRCILALAALEDMEIHQMDVKTAFLNGELEEEIYMEHVLDSDPLGSPFHHHFHKDGPHSNCLNITHMHVACWNYLIHVKCGSMRGHMLGGS